MTPDCREKWIGGLHTPSDGRAEPALAAPAIAEAARACRRQPASTLRRRGLESEAGKVAMVVTEQGAIRTGAVLLAGRLELDLPRRQRNRTPAAHGAGLGDAHGEGAGRDRRRNGHAGLLDPPPPRWRLQPGAERRRLRDHAGCLPLHARLLACLPPGTSPPEAPLRPGLLPGPGAAAGLGAGSAKPFEAQRILDPEPDHGLLNQALANLQGRVSGAGRGADGGELGWDDRCDAGCGAGNLAGRTLYRGFVSPPASAAMASASAPAPAASPPTWCPARRRWSILSLPLFAHDRRDAAGARRGAVEPGAYRPFHTGARFSAKARAPSFWSSLP